MYFYIQSVRVLIARTVYDIVGNNCLITHFVLTMNYAISNIIYSIVN